MKILLAAALLLAATTAAYAACTTSTVWVGNRVVICQSCCFGNHCTVNCY